MTYNKNFAILNRIFTVLENTRIVGLPLNMPKTLSVALALQTLVVCAEGLEFDICCGYFRLPFQDPLDPTVFRITHYAAVSPHWTAGSSLSSHHWSKIEITSNEWLQLQSNIWVDPSRKVRARLIFSVHHLSIAINERYTGIPQNNYTNQLFNKFRLFYNKVIEEKTCMIFQGHHVLRSI